MGMKIRFISYGHKFYEAEGLPAPAHDFLFSLRDLKNPYWIPELKPFTGLDKEVQDFFERDEAIQKRLNEITNLTQSFIEDFALNQHRNDDDSLTFAFKCTGGKHRSTYFAQKVFDALTKVFTNNAEPKLELEIEHIDLPRHSNQETLA